MSSWTRVLAPSLVWLICAAAPSALAQQEPAETRGSEDAEAKALFQAGRVAFGDGRYESALDYFNKAYELSQRPTLLYNIASAADRLREDQQALEAFERYLQLAPDSEHRSAVEARIVVLERTLAERAAPADPPPSQTAEPTPEPTPAAAQSPTPAGHGQATGPGAAPWILVATSGAVAVAGAVFVVLAVGDVATVEDADDGTRWSEIEAANDRAPVLSGVGIAMIGLGAAGVAVGLVWASSADDSPALSITPGGLMLRGSL